MLGFDPITKCNFRPNDYYYDGISGYTLKEVVIIGYGSRKKVDNTAIVSLKAEEISRTKVLNASQAIQGKSCRCTSGIIRFTG
jgi:hypothetical protein